MSLLTPEITRLVKAHFEAEVDVGSLIETPAGDFLVLRMSRPRQYSKNAVACAAGMGEDRAYLVTIAGEDAYRRPKISWLRRYFPGPE